MKKNFKSIISLLSLGMIFGVAGCENGTLAAPHIELDDNVVSWSEIANATGYEVNVGLESYDTTNTNYTIDVTTPGEYQVFVKAFKGEGEARKYSGKSNTVTYSYNVNATPLTAPVISLTGKTVTWAPVSNASSYQVYVNDALSQTTLQTSYTFTGTEPGDYVVKVKALSTNDLYTESAFSNTVTITINPVLTKLGTPVITLTGSTISWTAIEHADEYYIYANGELADTTTNTSYTFTSAIYGSYELSIRAVSYDNEHYSTSDESNKVSVFVKLQEGALDFTKPIAMYSKNWATAISFKQEDGYMFKGTGVQSVTSWQGKSFQFVSNGSGQYWIKLDNGNFLTHVHDSVADQDRFYAAPKLKSGNTQLFTIEKVENDDYCYFIYPCANPGYCICEDSSGYYHQYMKMGTNGDPSTYNAAQIFVLFNVETTVGADIIDQSAPTKGDITAPFVMYENQNKYIATINNDGLLVNGVASTETITDYSKCAFRAIAYDDTYYVLKMADGKVLTHVNSGRDYFYAQDYKGTNNQLFKFWDPEDGTWQLAPKDNQGYYMCTDNSGGFNQYNDSNYPGTHWTVLSADITISNELPQVVADPQSLTSPFIMWDNSNKKLVGIDSNDQLVVSSTANDAELADAKTFAFQMIADGNYYKIKYSNGKYLTYVNDGGDKFFAQVKNGTDAQLFKVTANGTDTYNLFPKNNQSYPITANGSAYAQWNDANHPAAMFTIKNVTVTMDDDQGAAPVAQDLTTPFVMWDNSNKKLVGIDSNDQLVVSSTANDAELADAKTFAFQMIADGNYYKIKYSNGKYLTYVNDGGDKFFAQVKNGTDAQLFKVTANGTDTYNLFPKNNQSYPVTASGSAYAQWNDANHPAAMFTIKNVTVTMDDDQSAPAQQTPSLEKTFVMWDTQDNKIMTLDDNGILVLGSTSKDGTISDYSKCAFKLVKVGNFYRIKCANGKYLTYDNASGDKFIAKDLIETEGDSTQLFSFDWQTENVSFNLVTRANAGYFVTTNNAGGYALWNNPAHPGAVFQFKNVDYTIA